MKPYKRDFQQDTLTMELSPNKKNCDLYIGFLVACLKVSQANGIE